MKREEYILNPTKVSSLTYWKTNEIKLPLNMLILNDEDFDESLLSEYEDRLYFKMFHDLKYIEEVKLPVSMEFVDCTTEEYANHINECYDDEGITEEELGKYQTRAVFDKELWIALYDNERKKIVATGIAEFDRIIKEGSLDWIQVSKEHRKQGYGKIIVCELLKRLKEKADFVTVSGRIDNETKPEILYKKCGFTKKEIWHVLRKKSLREG